MNEWPGAAILNEKLTERGASRRLALELGTDPSNVTRWKRGAWPDPQLWARIEQALDIPAGTLRKASGAGTTDQVAELAVRVTMLEESVSRRGDVVELRSLMADQSELIQQLSAELAGLGAEVARLRKRGSQGGGK